MAGKTTAEAKKYKKYIIIPNSREARQEGYVTVSTGEFRTSRILPFEKPIPLTEKEVAALKRMKEPIQVDRDIDVHEIMDRHRITQDKANLIARRMDQDPQMGGKRISFTPKYTVVPA